MASENTPGARIRQARLAAGLKQAELAARAGISAPYLNLIEHDRRKIAGKLLIDLAKLLDVEATLLRQGAEAALIAGKQSAEIIEILGYAGRGALVHRDDMVM